MLTKYVKLLKKQYVMLSIFSAAFLLLAFLPISQENRQSEAVVLAEKPPEAKYKKIEKREDVFLSVKEVANLQDPFLLARKTVPEKVETKQALGETMKTSAVSGEGKFSLVGILRNENKAKALIRNGNTVASVELGSNIAGYVVIFIGEQEVYLESSEEKLHVSFAK